MPTRPIAARETSWTVIGLFLAVKLLLVVAAVTLLLRPLSSLAWSTGYLVHPDLVVAWLLMLLSVGGVLFGVGRLRPRDVGLAGAHVLPGLAATAGVWLLMQAVLALGAVASGVPLEVHAQWIAPGPRALMGFLAAMLLGMALLEEVSFRGFLLAQLRLKLPPGHRGLWGAVLLSAAVFAVFHLPTRMLVSAVPPGALAGHLAVLTGAGILGALLYLRTGNLFVAVGVHALVNAPTQVVASPWSPFAVTLALTGLLWIAWPLLAGGRPHLRVGDLASAASPARVPAGAAMAGA